MDIPDWLALLVILICLALSFFFSGSETALTAFSRARMLRMEKAGSRNAGIVNRLTEARERLIGGILLGNNVVNIAASSLATGLMLAWFGDVGVVYATIVMTAIVVVFTRSPAEDHRHQCARTRRPLGRAADSMGRQGARPDPDLDRDAGPMAAVRVRYARRREPADPVGA